MYHWLLIQFKPNSYKTAERNLNKQGFKTFLPLLKITNRNRSKFTNIMKPLFPGYMFVGVESNENTWRRINSTLGVSRLVYFGGKPKEIQEEFVSNLMSRCDKFGLLISPNKPVVGDSVRLLNGALADFVATVETIDADQRIGVMMEFLGRSTRIKVASDNIIRN